MATQPTPSHSFARFFRDGTPGPLASSSSSSHLVDIGTDPACHLLDTPSAVRCLVLDYLDDTSAIRCLSSCRSLHAGYHSYPLKQAVSIDTIKQLSQLDVFERYVRQTVACNLFYLTLGFVLNIILTAVHNLPVVFVVVGLDGLLLLIVLCLVIRVCFARRKDCCARGRRLGTWHGWRVLPRVRKLQGPLFNLKLLDYLKHLTELETCSFKLATIDKQHPLPHSLLTLRLHNSPDLRLKPGTLPPRLTSLTLGSIKNVSLPADVLPESLTSLHLTAGFDTDLLLGEGVLPAGLQRLRVDICMRPLSDIALPPSLIELDIRSLADHPLSVLPAQLQVLRIGGAFNQPLTGVLPSGLRLLKLVGLFEQPLTADLFACTPQLEELHLSEELAQPRHLDVSVLPRSLRVLRLGKHYSFAIPQPADKPPQLRRVLVSDKYGVERFMALRQLGQSRDFTVTIVIEAGEQTIERELEDLLRQPPRNAAG